LLLLLLWVQYQKGPRVLIKLLTTYTNASWGFKPSYARRPQQPSVGTLGLCLPVLDEDPHSAIERFVVGVLYAEML